MRISPISLKDNTPNKVPKIKGKDNNMNRSFERNFNNAVRRENRKMNGSGGRR